MPGRVPIELHRHSSPLVSDLQSRMSARVTALCAVTAEAGPDEGAGAAGCTGSDAGGGATVVSGCSGVVTTLGVASRNSVRTGSLLTIELDASHLIDATAMPIPTIARPHEIAREAARDVRGAGADSRRAL